MIFEDLKHAQRERLEYLDMLFFWEGAATRASLIARFGISNPQAAIDFRIYLEKADAADIKYNAKSKKYLAGSEFIRLAGVPDVNELTTLIGGSGCQMYDVLPDLQRSQNMRVFVPLYRAMRANQSVEIFYQSMRDPEPTKRMISPTRFASDGVRVHVRAWCFLRQEYRDFIPARIDPDRSFQKSTPTECAPFDKDWNANAILTLAPHRRLTPAQKKVVRIEFGFKEDFMEVTVRKALEFYTKRRWGLEQENPRLELLSTRYEVLEEDSHNDD